MISNTPKLNVGIISLLLGFVFNCSVFAQSDFRAGYYITLENDTIHGLIDYRGETKNSKVCAYKSDVSAKTDEYAPGEILAYRFIDSKYYISKTIEIDKGEELVFVEFLVDGITNLYFYRDVDNYLYILEDEDGELIELSNEDEIVKTEGNKEISRKSNNHIRYLKAAYAECMEIQPQIDRTLLTHKSLISLTKNYHGIVCEDEECIVYEKQVPAVSIQIAPIIGFTFSGFNIKGGFYSRFSYDKNTNPSLGVQLNMGLPRVNEKLSCQIALLYNDNEIYGVYREYYQLYIKNKLLQSSIMLKYNFPKGRIRPTIALGGASNFILNHEVTAFVANVPDEPPTERHPDINLSTTLLGFTLQVGCNFRIFKNREIFSNLSYSRCSGSKDTPYDGRISTIMNSVNLHVGFNLFKTK